MKKAISILLSAVIGGAAIVAPLAITAKVTADSPAQYGQSFFAGLKVKHDRLKSVEGERIILVGGSNLAFGIDSALLEEYTGLPVVNYGLYAALGTKAMLDMAKPNVKKGDIVIIIPEEDSQTYSLYYNGIGMWYALESDYSMFWDVGSSNWANLVASLPEFAAEKYDLAKRGETVNSSGLYSLASLNEYGEIAVEKKYNRMVNGGLDQPLKIDTELVTEKFTDYLNDYAADLERRGATVWFSFAPMNEAAITTTDEQVAEFYATLGKALDFPIISGIEDYMLDKEFFYDTNFHLNETGVKHRTAVLADDINRELAKFDAVKTVKYKPPTRPASAVEIKSAEGDEVNASYLKFEENADGLTVVGLSDAGLEQTKLTIPNTHDGKPVVSIGSDAFASSTKLETVVIPEWTMLVSLAERAFADCASLKRIEIGIEPSRLAANAKVFDGMADGCQAYVPDKLFTVYATDYFWSGLMKYVKRAEG